jgi:hypothetical protein
MLNVNKNPAKSEVVMSLSWPDWPGSFMGDFIDPV